MHSAPSPLQPRDPDPPHRDASAETNDVERLDRSPAQKQGKALLYGARELGKHPMPTGSVRSPLRSMQPHSGYPKLRNSASSPHDASGKENAAPTQPRLEDSLEASPIKLQIAKMAHHPRSASTVHSAISPEAAVLQLRDSGVPFSPSSFNYGAEAEALLLQLDEQAKAKSAETTTERGSEQQNSTSRGAVKAEKSNNDDSLESEVCTGLQGKNVDAGNVGGAGEAEGALLLSLDEMCIFSESERGATVREENHTADEEEGGGWDICPPETPMMKAPPSTPVERAAPPASLRRTLPAEGSPDEAMSSRDVSAAAAGVDAADEQDTVAGQGAAGGSGATGASGAALSSEEAEALIEEVVRSRGAEAAHRQAAVLARRKAGALERANGWLAASRCSCQRHPLPPAALRTAGLAGPGGLAEPSETGALRAENQRLEEEMAALQAQLSSAARALTEARERIERQSRDGAVRAAAEERRAREALDQRTRALAARAEASEAAARESGAARRAAEAAGEEVLSRASSELEARAALAQAAVEGALGGARALWARAGAAERLRAAAVEAAAAETAAAAARESKLAEAVAAANDAAAASAAEAATARAEAAEVAATNAATAEMAAAAAAEALGRQRREKESLAVEVRSAQEAAAGAQARLTPPAPAPPHAARSEC